MGLPRECVVEPYVWQRRTYPSSLPAGYAVMGSEAILFVPLFLGFVTIQSGCPEATKQVYTDIKTFDKPYRATTLK